MEFFQPVRDRKTAPSLVDQTVAAIEQAIRGQWLRPGMALPSIRDFARVHGLSAFTVSAAYGRLVAQNWLVSRPGSGFRVAPQVPATAPEGLERSAPRWVPPQVGPSWLLADVFADHSIPIKAGCGWLPADWLNQTALRQALRQVARTPVSQIAAYGHPYGYFPLRDYLRERMAAQGVAVTADQVLLTSGATQALDIVVRSLLRPGDVIAVEDPCYANVLPTLRLAGITVVGVPRTPEGLCCDTLERLAKQHAIRALFVTTVLQNPTGASLTMNNAFRVLQLAERYDFRVIEDDVSRDLLPHLGPMLVALGGARRVIYVGGFSKSIMPSMRVGYVVADGDFVQQLAKIKMTMGLTTPELMERTVHHVVRQGGHAAHLRRVQERLHQAHDALYGLLDTHDFQVFARPQAGLFVWARPTRGRLAGLGAAELAKRALDHGIWLAPAGYFSPTADDAGWIRFNVAYSANPALWQFMRQQA